MGRFAEKHPRELCEIVGRAIANGQSAAETHRQLAAGTLAGWQGAYQMPLETVRYYGKQYKRKRQAQTIAPEAANNPKGEVDRLARLLLTAAQRGVEQSVARTEPDRKALKEWADALKGIQALVSDSEPDRPSTSRKPKAPSDPLTAALTSAAKQQEPVPHTPRSETGTEGSVGPATETEPTHTETHHAAGLPQAPQIAPSSASVPASLAGELLKG